MISDIELRHIIERAFMPLKCVCEINSQGRLTIKLGDQGHTEALTVTSIDPSRVANSRAIAGLVSELKEEMRLGRMSLRKHSQGKY